MILPIPSPVTSPEEPELLLTGSYDDFIRVYQTPSLYNSKPKVLTQRDIGCKGGGVWRLKFLNDPTLSSSSPSLRNESIPKRRFVVLASCMRVGCKILEIKETQEGEWTIDVLARTAIHESMNYASDFLPLVAEGQGDAISKDRVRTIVSTSFYDRLLFVWNWDPALEIGETLE